MKKHKYVEDCGGEWEEGVRSVMRDGWGVGSGGWVGEWVGGVGWGVGGLKGAA